MGDFTPQKWQSSKCYKSGLFLCWFTYLFSQHTTGRDNPVTGCAMPRVVGGLQKMLLRARAVDFIRMVNMSWNPGLTAALTGRRNREVYALGSLKGQTRRVLVYSPRTEITRWTEEAAGDGGLVIQNDKDWLVWVNGKFRVREKAVGRGWGMKAHRKDKKKKKQSKGIV